MDLNTSMRFVMVRARSEAAALKTEEMYTEHLFLALLKLSEMTAEEISPTSRHKQQMDEDIAEVRRLLKKAEIESRSGRSKLRKILQDEKTFETGRSSVEIILSQAAKSAGDDIITAAKVLTVILTEPTPILKTAFHLEKKDDKKPEKPAAPEAEKKSGADGIAWLPQLTQRIRNMRYTLLEKVFGQDHVIHAFAEGMFSAEVLAAADEKRKRPRAIFVFAGPPGVGKTFLAEQAAELLAIPFKRFDMSSYADHQAQMNLIGFAPSYKDAKPGLLTGFVKENPHSILLFDEIEKAHLNTIHLFLQILDAGVLHDDFLDETVPFKDTIIIFTTNAGRPLYEGDAKANAAAFPRQVILNALETDKHPQTGKPFFPTAICSRLATGFPIMFNHLKAHDLEKISAAEFMRFGELFEKQYGIKVSADNLLAATLLFVEGGQVDARTLRAQTELFFKNEIFKLCRLLGDNFENRLEKLKSIHFQVETTDAPDEVKLLFKNPSKPEILLFSNNLLDEEIKQQTPGINIHIADDIEQALNILGKNEVNFVLLELTNDSAQGGDVMETLLWGEEAQPDGKTIYDFENVPMAASSLRKSRIFFKTLHERLPEMPVYLLESERFKIDDELLAAFIRSGARGKLVLAQGNLGVLADEIALIAMQSYLQNAAANLAAQSKVLSFETAPKLSDDKTKATIRVRELAVRRAVSAGDGGAVLDEVEKPQVHFSDVIGAGDAKEELQFFINYLKNPKKFSALGLKPPKGVLLYGPPGTGKTLLAKAMAGESNVAFIPAVASAFVTKYQGSGPEAVRELFNRARRYAPAIIFIDEIDAIGRARGKAGSAHGEEMALNALLTEMDGFSVDPKRPVFVLAATNFDVEEGKGGMGVIDAALARRFDRKILVDLPNKNDRQQYLELMLRKRGKNEVSDSMIQRLAGRAAGFSLANLESVMEMAARMAAKKNRPLNDELLEEAFELSCHGEKKDWGRQYLERVARHEAGHAYMCFLAGATPSYLTIIARGGHGGYMEHADTENSPLKTREELLGRIRTSLGGRAAEIVYYGDEEGISSGASGDLQSATRIARAMICAYGMDETIGLAVLSEKEATEGPMAEKITRRISEIIGRELDFTIDVIAKGKKKIDGLVEQLLEKNKLNKEEMEAILKK